LYTVSYILFSELTQVYVIAILGIIVAIAGSLRITCFGIIVRDKTKNGSVAKNEGLIYTSLNLAWLVGPLIAGFIAEKYGINKVFLFAAVMIFLSLALFDIFNIHDGRKCEKIDKNSFKIFINFFKTKKLLKSYILSGGGNFWWALIYTYIPIYMIQKGLSDITVGYFLFAIVIPLILSEYYFGKLAGKIGFKKMFVIGFSLLGIISIVCFFISNIYWLLAFLVLASFSVAMIEPTTEAYFLNIITPSQRDKYYGPYSTSIDINMFIATMAGAIILLFLPLKFVFLLFGAIMFIFVLISLSIKNIIENKK
jgi:MFS family permease